MAGAHSHSHSHSHSGLDQVETAERPRLILLVALALAALGTVVGLLALWPDGESPEAQFSAEGVTYETADIVEVHEPCPVIAFDPAEEPTRSPEFPDKCDQLTVELEAGERVTVAAEPGATRSGLAAGDRVKLVRIPSPDGGHVYSYFGTVRDFPIGALTAAFVLVVLVVARLRGLLSLLGLGVAGAVIGFFMLPALLQGSNPMWVALVGSAAIMFVVLYLAHGLSMRTSSALGGTLVGLTITGGLGLLSVHWAHLSGLGGESTELLRTYVPELEYRSILVAAIIVAGLGVLNDVTITQSSAVWELRAASATMTRRELFASGMRIGRDHIASTIYTIVFVYAGTALSTLLLVSLYDRSLLDLLLAESFAEEVVMTLVSSIGLVLAMPATTAIAALVVSGPEHDAS